MVSEWKNHADDEIHCLRCVFLAGFAGIVPTQASENRTNDEIGMDDSIDGSSNVMRRSSVRNVYSVENKSIQRRARGPLLGYCVVNVPNSKCAIVKSRSFSNSIQVGVGASKGWLAGQLGIEASRTISVSVQCESPALPKGAHYNAYSSGTRFRYKIRHQKRIDGFTVSNNLSGWLTSYRPDKMGVQCG